MLETTKFYTRMLKWVCVNLILPLEIIIKLQSNCEYIINCICISQLLYLCLSLPPFISLISLLSTSKNVCPSIS